MKTIAAIFLSIGLLSCGSDCDFVQNEYEKAKKIHAEKQLEADIILEKLLDIPVDSVTDHFFVEDELNFVLIDLAMIEIEMEAYKKQNFDCLQDY